MPFNSCVSLALNLFFHWCDEGAFPKDHQKTKWLKGCSYYSADPEGLAPGLLPPWTLLLPCPTLRPSAPGPGVSG